MSPAARSIYKTTDSYISPSVDSHQKVCQPTLESGEQDAHPGADHNAGSTSPTMVPHNPSHVGRLPEAGVL